MEISMKKLLNKEINYKIIIYQTNFNEINTI